MRTRFLHVLWAPNIGPHDAAYLNPSLAYDHARAMLGVQVYTCELREAADRSVFVVWSAVVGVIDAYGTIGGALARVARLFSNAVQVTELPLRERLPSVVVDDISSENDYEGESDSLTPVDGVVVAVGDLDDQDM